MAEDQVQDQQQSEPAPAANETVEKEARLFGWVPKEEFRGSENDWVDADTFVKRGKEINPILRKNNETLMKKLDEKVKEIDEIKASVEEFKKFQKEAYERKQIELQAQIIELKAQKKTAIAEGNGDLVVDIDDQLDKIKEAQAEAKAESKEPPPQVSAPQEIDPEIGSWLERNTWFNQDPEMTEISNALGASLRRQFPSLSGRAFLDKLDERIANYFPEKTSLGKKARGSAVDSTGNVRAGGSGGKKSYDALPPEAKAACDKFIKQGLFKTKQEYVDNYDWE
jgi:hypothetical protein